MIALIISTLFTTSIFGTSLGNPHEFIFDCRDSIVKSCTECHNSESVNSNISSTSCLSCHDGVNCSSIDFTTPESENSIDLHMSPSLQKGHPVEVEYLEGVSGLKNKNSEIFG